MKQAKQINLTIGANIQKARVKAHMTQEQLSERIGIGATSLSAIERGAVGVSLTTLRNICGTLSVSSDVLLFGDDLPQNDVRDLADRLARLSPDQFEIVSEVFTQLLAAFSLR